MGSLGELNNAEKSLLFFRLKGKMQVKTYGQECLLKKGVLMVWGNTHGIQGKNNIYL